MNSIKKSRNMFIFADKSWNIYKTDKGTHLLKLLNVNVKTYKK